MTTGHKTFFRYALLVYAAVKSWLDTLIVLIDIPLACVGALLALLLTGMHFSVSAAMDFQSIFGVALQDAILVVSYSSASVTSRSPCAPPRARRPRSASVQCS